MPTMTLAEIAALVGGRVAGNAGRAVSRAAPPEAAGDGDITFVFSPKALQTFLASAAGAAVVPEGPSVEGRDVIHHRNPPAAMARILAALHPDERPAAGIHPTAVVHETATVDATATVGPCAVIEAGATVGAGAIVGAGCHVGAGSAVGEGTRLHPTAVLYAGVRVGRGCIVHSGVVLGADGFGYVRTGGQHVKIPQVSGVEVGDDVEIGANTCIDRGTMTPTRIGSNTKIDNLTQVGHNCDIGNRVIVCGQAAIAGTTTIEDDVTLAGQVGVAGHLTIGRGSVAAAGSGITSDVAPGSKIAGHPQMPLPDWLRMQAMMRQLPELKAELKRLQQRVTELEAERGRAGSSSVAGS